MSSAVPQTSDRTLPHVSEAPPAPSRQPARSPRGRFVLVDALRGVASFWVVLFHANAAGHIPSLSARMPNPVRLLFNTGWAGVPIFFVLSGFVIAHSVSGYRVDGGFVWRFALRRSIRLDPPYWVSMAVAVALGVLSTHFVAGKAYAIPSAGAVLAHVAYVQEILGVREIQDVYWTLCLEIQFYVVFCLLVWAAHALRRDPLDRRGLYGVFLPALAVAAAWAIFRLPAWSGSFLPQWHGFLLGMLACWVVTGAAPLAMFVGFAALIGVVVIRGSATDAVFSGACLVTAVLLLVAGRAGKLGTWLSWRPLQVLGTISYSLYLVHNPVSGAAFRIVHRLTPHHALGDAVALVFTAGCALAAAWVLWRLVETPTQALSKRIRFAAGGRSA